jgi:polysaccharide biosynthesis protein PslH
MKMTIVAMETPFPPNHGGRVDIWRRIVALSQLGVDIQLICWDYNLPSPENVSAINQYVKDFYPVVYQKDLYTFFRRGFDFLKYPLQVTSRIVRGHEKRTLYQRVKDFAPDLILADQIHTGLLAKNLSQALRIPLIARSHNIEHLHYEYLLNSAKGMNRLKLMACLWHLKAYELSILRESKAFYDISIDDLNFWQNQGLTNGKFLAPLIDISSLEESPSPGQDYKLNQDGQTEYDIVFLGNLRTENNVAGVIWFLQKVLPKIKSELPDTTVLISGSDPMQVIVDICQSLDGVSLKANPVSARAVYQSGKVLINPVSVGSGVSIKSVDMLTLNRPIVTLRKGILGLPIQAREYFSIADDAEGFSRLVCESLKSPSSHILNQAEILNIFGYPAIEGFLVDLKLMLRVSG